MQPITITKSNFETEVTKSEKPVLLDFWAPWCGPCEAIAPSIDEIAQEVPHIKVGKINVDDDPELAAAFGAMSIPLLAFVKDGAVVNQILGAVPKEKILQIIE
ncbi:MAG: thioredoxin [Defluviitaleaceae bacterium]|nr:thioredoxin [Defluviitaleaceae bacterium]MCL2262609.1 thioredoxin [Defluviitaleaceae bacterium]